MGYEKFFKQKHYTFQELVGQAKAVKAKFPSTRISYSKGTVTLEILLRPTEISNCYKVKLYAKINKKGVNVFVIEPYVDLVENGKRVPHLYSDGSLCLYYPKYKEWEYNDLWAETIIPWTCLWLFYYEIWKETGEWLGGGIHNTNTIKTKNN